MSIDFGIYHHSTREDSELLRKVVRDFFYDSFNKIGIQKNEEITVLDVGCGLGFLSYITAEYFPRAKILGIDTFEDSSLLNSSMQKAEENMQNLNIQDRVHFKRINVFNISRDLGYFDIIVSNLVLHNLGKKRFRIYEKITEVMNDKSFFINGDLLIGNSIEESFLYEINKIYSIFKILYFRKTKLKPSVMYYMVVLKLNKP